MANVLGFFGWWTRAAQTSTPQLPEAVIDEGLSKHCCPPLRWKRKGCPPLLQETFQQISGLLRCLDKLYGRVDSHETAWRYRPRTYTVLRNINALELMDHFIQHGFNGFHFPYSDDTLPDFVTRSDTREDLLSHQSYVLTDIRLLDVSKERHLSFNCRGERFFGVLQDLGHGGFG